MEWKGKKVFVTDLFDLSLHYSIHHYKYSGICNDVFFKQYMFIFISVFYENDEYYCKPSELMSKEEGAVALLTRTKVWIITSSFSICSHCLNWVKKTAKIKCRPAEQNQIEKWHRYVVEFLLAYNQTTESSLHLETFSLILYLLVCNF